MRNHRMFSTKIVTDDRFTSLPARVQLLYFQLIASADDEGFVGNLRMIVPRKTYITALIDAGLVHVFCTGPALILHWFCHNAVKASHAKQTLYQDEKALVILDENKVYRLKTEERDSGILPAKEKKREEKESKEKEREEKKSKEKESKEKKTEEKESKEKDASAAAEEACGASLSDKEQNFNIFWDAYPKKSYQELAKNTFLVIDEEFNAIMEGLEHHKKSNQWVSDNGFFIPDAHNWLRKRGWENRPPLYKPKATAAPTGAAGGLGPEELAAIRRTMAEATA